MRAPAEHGRPLARHHHLIQDRRREALHAGESDLLGAGCGKKQNLSILGEHQSIARHNPDHDDPKKCRYVERLESHVNHISVDMHHEFIRRLLQGQALAQPQVRASTVSRVQTMWVMTSSLGREGRQEYDFHTGLFKLPDSTTA